MPEACSVYKLGEPEEREGPQVGGRSLSLHPAPLLALAKGMFPLDPLLEAAFPCPQHYLLASAVFTVHIMRESDTPPPKNMKGTQRTLPAALRGWACPPDANIALPSHLRAPTTPSLKLPA